MKALESSVCGFASRWENSEYDQLFNGEIRVGHNYNFWH